MPAKKRARKEQSTVKVGNIGNNRGAIHIAGGDIKIDQSVSGLNAKQAGQLFDQLYKAIESRTKTSLADKRDLKSEIKEIQTTVTDAIQNNQKVNESFLSRRFRNIARMAPDILDVMVATLAGPFSGLGILAEKIAQKAKEEVQAP